MKHDKYLSVIAKDAMSVALTCIQFCDDALELCVIIFEIWKKSTLIATTGVPLLLLCIAVILQLIIIIITFSIEISVEYELDRIIAENIMQAAVYHAVRYKIGYSIRTLHIQYMQSSWWS